ncbi:MAG: sigma-70 family RNA polymerase sigma factor [Planctomycetota bacterium]|nr:sigma-70 family RNA polymerase sigma factor [Planctomycetota bacterium]
MLDARLVEALPRLRRIARAIVGPHRPDDAEELLQRTLTRLLASDAASIADQHAALAYARTTMMRIWIDEQRSTRRRVRRLLRLAATSAPFSAPPSAADEVETLEALRRACANLPPRHRAAIALRVVEELSYAEIAAALQISEENVRACCHRARRALRHALGEPQ